MGRRIIRAHEMTTILMCIPAKDKGKNKICWISYDFVKVILIRKMISMKLYKM